MQRALTLLQTTVGKKAIVAVTGVVLLGFVVGHMAGNLQIYLGAEKLNAYAAFLHGNPGLLWTARIVLLVSVVAHIVYSMQLASLSGDARARRYAHRTNNATNLAALSMRLSGPTLGLFIVYHLLHLTFGKSPVPHSPTDVYANVVGSFSVWWLAAIYVVAQLLLGLHLFHGAWSFFQTLGLNHPRYNGLRRQFATGVTALVVLGNVSIPVAVQAGWLRLDGATETTETTETDETIEARLEVR